MMIDIEKVPMGRIEMIEDFDDVKLEDMVAALANYQDVIERDVPHL